MLLEKSHSLFLLKEVESPEIGLRKRFKELDLFSNFGLQGYCYLSGQFSPCSCPVPLLETSSCPDLSPQKVSVYQLAHGTWKKSSGISQCAPRVRCVPSHDHLLIPKRVTGSRTVISDKIIGHRKRLACGWSLRLIVKEF